MKTFKEIKQQIDEAFKVMKHDISDWSEDGIDDIMNELQSVGAKDGKDYKFEYKGNKAAIIFKTKKVEEIMNAFFHK
jgi:hypothetical protein